MKESTGIKHSTFFTSTLTSTYSVYYMNSGLCCFVTTLMKGKGFLCRTECTAVRLLAFSLPHFCMNVLNSHHFFKKLVFVVNSDHFVGH